MTRRSDLVLAGHTIMWPVLLAMLFLLACQIKGFDPTLCRVYSQCGWMDA